MKKNTAMAIFKNREKALELVLVSEMKIDIIKELT